jgi:ABC-2 type transport system ATP-binding protein
LAWIILGDRVIAQKVVRLDHLILLELYPNALQYACLRWLKLGLGYLWLGRSAQLEWFLLDQRSLRIRCCVIAEDGFALQCSDVEKSFGSLTALDGLNLEVLRGERVALLGPNGAGKTTLVRAICGRVRLDKGVIRLFNAPAGSPKALQHLGVVPQEIALYGDLTAQENLVIFAKLHGLRRREATRRVAEVLEWIGLKDRAHELVKNFSGGMKRRVNLACGVLHHPPLILLDEPTVGVDPQSRERIFLMLDELSKQGAAIILTTHHLDEAEKQSDRIVIMDHGRVIAEGSLADLIEQTVGSRRQLVLQIYKNNFFAAFHSGPNEQVALARLELESLPGFQFHAASGGWTKEIDDVAQELPPLLDQLRQRGLVVADLEIRNPNLHHVFLHLTGKELRE